MRFARLVIALVGISAVSVQAKSVGGYTNAQAARGAAVYTQYCAVCHGANLQGEAGTPLMGRTFLQAYGAGTAAQLYDFLSRQMPLNAPGSLSQQQYLDVTAFILERNGLPPGDAPLSTEFTRSRAPLGNAHGGGRRLIQYRRDRARGTADPQGIRAASRRGERQHHRFDDAQMPDPTRTTGCCTGEPTITSDIRPSGRSPPRTCSSLTPVALVQTGMTASFETTPIVANGVMYLTTPVVDHKMKILAVNAVTGERLWDVTYNLGAFQICCGPVNRGVAVGYGNVYVVTLDDHLLALDASDGHTVWDTTIVGAQDGYSETLAPQIFDGMVIVGSAGGEWALRGFVAAYDATNGQQRWRWMSTDPKSYAGNSWESGGGMVWTTPAIDPKLGLLIFSTGNPNPDLDGTIRQGDNLYTDSIVALDVHSGELKWYYQEVKHDVWDYDAVSNVVLFDVHRNGEVIPAAAEAGKVGWVFILDRRTGRADPQVRPLRHDVEEHVLDAHGGGS